MRKGKGVVELELRLGWVSLIGFSFHVDASVGGGRGGGLGRRLRPCFCWVLVSRGGGGKEF